MNKLVTKLFIKVVEIPSGGSFSLRMRLYDAAHPPKEIFGRSYDEIFAQRLSEHKAFYSTVLPPSLTEEEKQVAIQAYAGLLWSKQFYHYTIQYWLKGDPSQVVIGQLSINKIF